MDESVGVDVGQSLGNVHSLLVDEHVGEALVVDPVHVMDDADQVPLLAPLLQDDDALEDLGVGVSLRPLGLQVDDVLVPGEALEELDLEQFLVLGLLVHAVLLLEDEVDVLERGVEALALVDLVLERDDGLALLELVGEVDLEFLSALDQHHVGGQLAGGLPERTAAEGVVLVLVASGFVVVLDEVVFHGVVHVL